MFKHLALASLLLAPTLAGCIASDATPDEQIDANEDAVKACAKNGTVKGVDVSYYQGHVDWKTAHAHGIRFAFARVSDGTGFLDPQFGANWSGMKSAGVIRGVYQFFRPGQDPIAQANLLLNELKKHGG